MTIRKLYLKNEQGLTLVELMIVLVLSMFLMAAVYYTYQLQHTSGQVQYQIAASQQDLRAVVEIISSDIRHAGLDPTVTKNIQGIVSNDSGANSLRMRMDFNRDGLTNTANEDITYRINGEDLERVDNNAGVTQIIAHNVTVLNFSYRDKQYALVNPTTTDLADSIRYVQVSLNILSEQADPQTHERIARTLAATVCRRNGLQE
jgi:type II secretory pathway component PulJ